MAPGGRSVDMYSTADSLLAGRTLAVSLLWALLGAFLGGGGGGGVVGAVFEAAAWVLK